METQSQSLEMTQAIKKLKPHVTPNTLAKKKFTKTEQWKR